MALLRIAHRGASAAAPENTGAAIDQALRLGVDLVEVDVRATADGRLVLLHDEDVGRTTDGTGPLRDMTLDEVRRLDAGGWFGPAFRGEPVPTLDEAVDRVRGRALLLVEVKEAEIAAEVVACVGRHDALDHVVVQSFSDQAVRSSRRAEPRVPCGLLWGAGAAEDAGFARAVARAAASCGAGIVGLDGRGVTADRVRYLQRRGLSVWTWTLNEPDAIRAAIEARVDGIISDRPDRIPSG